MARAERKRAPDDRVAAMYAAYRAHGITDPDALSLLSDLAATLNVPVDDPQFGEALTLLKDLDADSELIDL